MTEKNWTKIAALITFLGLISGLLFGIYTLPTSPTFTEAAKYFALTLVLLLGLFIYFQFLKE